MGKLVALAFVYLVRMVRSSVEELGDSLKLLVQCRYTFPLILYFKLQALYHSVQEHWHAYIKAWPVESLLYLPETFTEFRKEIFID